MVMTNMLSSSSLPFLLQHPSPSPSHRHLSFSRPISPPLRLHGGLRCSRRDDPAPPGSIDSKAVLDAFFLGKAFAETITERIESTVGEFVSTLGRLQAEQQKQLRDLQGEVFERAKKAKEKAALEALGEQGVTFVPTPTSADDGTPVNRPTSTGTPGDEDFLLEMTKN